MTAVAALAIEAPPVPAQVQSRQRDTLVRRLADLLFLPSDQASPFEKGLVDEILTKLYASLDRAMRARLARRLSDLAEPPQRLLKLMASDDIDIARLFLERAELFDDAELARLAASVGPDHRALIARRHNVGAATTDVLVKTGDAELILVLLSNAGARFSLAGFDALVKLSRLEPLILDRLLARADLPAPLAHEIFWWAGPAPRRHILQRYSMERRLLIEAIADLTPAAAQTHDSDIDWALHYSGAIRVRTRLETEDLSALTDWLIAPLDTGLRQKLAALLSIDPGTVNRAVSDNGGEPAVILLKAAGLSTAQFKGLAHVLADRSQADHATQFDALVSLFQSLSTDWADLVLRFWDQQSVPEEDSPEEA